MNEKSAVSSERNSDDLLLRPRVMVVTEDRSLARSLRRVVHSAGGECLELARVDHVRNRMAYAPDVILCDLHESGRCELALRELQKSSPLPVIVVLNAQPTNQALGELIAECGSCHVIARPGDEPVNLGELFVTFKKLFQRDIFGLDKHLRWGASHASRYIAASDDKADALTDLSKFLDAIGVDKRLAVHLVTVADELVTNAIYNAPVDGAGAPRYAARSRRDPVVLADAEAAVLEYASDGRHVAVACRDPFGSIDLGKLRHALGRAVGGADPQVRWGTGGAGIGLDMVYRAVDQLVVNVAPRRATELIGICDLEQAFRDRRATPKSAHVFVSPA